MKKLWLILAVLVFVSVNTSAQLTSGLMNYEVKHGLLPKVAATRKTTVTEEKKTAPTQEQLTRAVAKAQLKGAIKHAYQEIGQDAQKRLKEVMNENKNIKDLILPVVNAHQRILEVASEDRDAQYAYQAFLTPVESLYLAWGEVVKKNAVVAEELRNIVIGHCYWVEATQTHLSLEEIVQEISSEAVGPVTVKGEAEGFYQF